MDGSKTSPKIVLVVEDEASLAHLLEEKLRADGFHVLTAADGKVGLALAMEQHPNIILLDLLMPVMDGVTMLKELRKDAWGASVPVIVLSNLGDSKHVFESLSNGALDYLVKSDMDLETILRQIHARLDIKPRSPSASA